jgi:TPR repeat protein
MRELGRFAAADNSMTTLAILPRFFLNDGQLLRYVGASDSPDSITLGLEKNDGGVFDFVVRADPDYGTAAIRWLTMAAASGNPPPLYKTHSSENYWFEYLPEQRAVYLQINLMNDMDSEPFADFCQRALDTLDQRQAAKLIIDVRGCPGGDHIEMPLLKGILARPQIDQSDRLFLIIGRMTGSASEHLTAEFDRYTNATLFGEGTGSKPNQYGAMQQFTLPHSQLQVSCALKYFQDAEPSDYSVSSLPDIFVPKLSSDSRLNRDAVLERIFDYDSFKQLRPQFQTLLSEAYLSGGLGAFQKAYDSVKSMYVDYGFNMENLLYRDLDVWMSQNKRSEEDYVEYLTFIHQELPNSIAVCYDLAYWMNDRGNKDEARRLWEQCLAMNPEHHHAKWRLGLMKLDETWTPNRQ